MSGPAIQNVARREQQFSEDSTVITWAMMIWVLLESGVDTLPAEHVKTLRDHVDRCTAAAIIRGWIHECVVVRAWAGDATLIRMAVAPELQNIANAVLRICVAMGGQVKYGPAPRICLHNALETELCCKHSRLFGASVRVI
jgi:hypothetical protein